MFLGYCGAHFRNDLSHITADRNVLPVSAVHLLLVKSEPVRQFHKKSREKFSLFRHFNVSVRVEKETRITLHGFL